MQHRRSLTIATGLAFGLSLGVAPHAAGAQVVDTATVALDPMWDAVWPVDALDAFVVAVPAATVPAPAVSSPVTTPAPADATDAPVTVTLAPATAAVESHPVQSSTVQSSPDSGSVTVEVTMVDGADRSVSLRAADGTLIGSAAVDGEPIVFDGLPAGTYDLRVEQLTHSGGTFLTRTIIDLDGNSIIARCDDETLECRAS